MRKVAIAMSGGVDSSVAAALLKERGFDVIGITMVNDSGTQAVEAARNAALKLGIPHYVIDIKEAFFEKIIKPFCLEYIRGRTPNPCTKCNKIIKFGFLLERARELGAELFATGHYARVEFCKGRYLLKKGKDPDKDQSYMLYLLTQEELSRTLFPLGELTKEEVRRSAEELKLPARAESQDICFVPDGDYGSFIKKLFPEAARKGPILNTKGEVIGEHKGLIFYTVGQRRGIGIRAGRPLYVVDLDPSRNAIIVGEEEELYSQEFIVGEANFIPFEKLEGALEVEVKIRYRHPEIPALIFPLEGGEILVKLSRPERAVTPGQAAVFYRGDIVIGGGTIIKAKRQIGTWPKASMAERGNGGLL